MVQLPSPIGSFGTGLYEGYTRRRDTLDEQRRNDEEQAFRNRMAEQQFALQSQQEQRMGSQMDWERQKYEQQTRQQLEQRYAEAGSKDISDLPEDRQLWYYENVIHPLEAQLGRPLSPFKPQSQPLRTQLESAAKIMPSTMRPNDALLRQAFPALGGQQQTPAPTANRGMLPWRTPLEQIRERQATPQSQSQELFVNVDKQYDPSMELSRAEKTLRENFRDKASPEKLNAAIRAYAIAYKRYTGIDLTSEDLAGIKMDAMTAVEADKSAQGWAGIDQNQQKIDQGSQRIAILDAAQKEAVRNHKAQEATALMNAKTSMQRANDMRNGRVEATGTAKLNLYKSFISQRTELLKSFAPDSPEVQGIDAEIEMIKSSLGSALPDSNISSGKTWSTTKYEGELAPDLKASAQAGIPAGKVGPALREELKARGLPTNLIQSEYVRLMKQFYDPYKRK